LTEIFITLSTTLSYTVPITVSYFNFTTHISTLPHDGFPGWFLVAQIHTDCHKRRLFHFQCNLALGELPHTHKAANVPLLLTFLTEEVDCTPLLKALVTEASS
jgi:hypothetical protein